MNPQEAFLALRRARSFLFVPGNRPERFAKALASGADAIVVDLEDSVPPAAKAAARGAVAAEWPALQQAAVPVVIRMNACGTPAGEEDLEWLTHLRPVGVMVPKCEGAADLERVALSATNAALLPLIENARGWATLASIASAAHVSRLVIGHIDFMAETGISCSDDERELDPLRFAVAMNSQLHGLSPAIDGVTTAIGDDAQLRADTQRASRFGFGGKLCIHPRQVAGVHEALKPSSAQVEWAMRVLAGDAAAGGAAFQLDGRMIDLPIVARARSTLSRVRQETTG